MRRVLACAMVMALFPANAEEPATMPVRIETPTRVHQLTVEVATTPEQRAQGLMGRDTLAPNAGMLFVYGRVQSGETGFWMYRTRIPLDIAFLDREGRIRAIRSMQPCREKPGKLCPSYLPHVPYIAALEVNGGYFSAHGIGPGDRVLFDPPAREGAKEGAG